MKKSLKAALAAGAGATLLLGGAGTLAYWSDTGTAGGTGITSGHLRLTGDTCSGWKMDGGATFVAQLVVPGDTLTQTCTFTVDAAGEHIAASFDVTSPSWGTSNDLTDELVAEATYKIGTDSVSAFPATVVDDDVVTATIQVTFTGAVATNDSQDLTAALQNITVTATQAHS